jgi:hypothetical protein
MAWLVAGGRPAMASNRPVWWAMLVIRASIASFS